MNYLFYHQVHRYDVMGDLYKDLKFYRKAAFYKRVAAMHCVNPTLASPSWLECYTLLMQAFPGFKMTLDPIEYTRGQISGHLCYTALSII